jgi:matrixin
VKRRKYFSTKWLVGSCIAALVAVSTVAIYPYNPFQDNVNGTRNITKWNTPNVSWELNPSTPSNNVTTTGGTTIQTAIANSFAAWTGSTLNGVTLNNLNVTQGPNSTVTAPNNNDCLNVIGFSDAASDFPTGTIAFTEVVTATGTAPFTFCSNQTANSDSVISDADIEFNPTIQFSTTGSPGANQFDVQSTATHEIGHLLGLDHSGLVHTVMFPFGDTSLAGVNRTLSTDDIIGIASLYPASSFASSTGQISGTITMSGTGVYAAHLIVIDTSTGNAVIDGLANSDGTYMLQGVPPGQYNLLVLPLSPNDSVGLYSLSDFLGWTCGYSENSPPCCDPTTDSTCTGTLTNPTNYTGKFF